MWELRASRGKATIARATASALVVALALLVFACRSESAQAPGSSPLWSGWYELTRPTLREGVLTGHEKTLGDVTFPLSDVAIFDCRTDCWTGVRSNLPPLRSGDTVCVFLTVEQGKTTIWKLWINRTTCTGGVGARPVAAAADA
jgi:hypothetical protein